MGRVITPPDRAVERWVNNLSASVDFIIEQVERSAWKPYAASDQAENNYKAEMQKVIAEGRRKKGVEASSDEVWKSGMRAIRGTFGTNVRASQARMAAVMSKLLPDIDNIRKGLPPRGPRGSDTNIQGRAVKLMQELAKNRGKYKAVGIPKSAT